MKIKDLVSQLDSFDPDKEIHFMTLTEYGYSGGEKSGKEIVPDMREEKDHPEKIAFRLVYHKSAE